LEPVSTKKSFSLGASDTKQLGDEDVDHKPMTLGGQQGPAFLFLQTPFYRHGSCQTKASPLILHKLVLK
jgi:hypothetical protein